MILASSQLAAQNRDASGEQMLSSYLFSRCSRASCRSLSYLEQDWSLLAFVDDAVLVMVCSLLATGLSCSINSLHACSCAALVASVGPASMA